MDIPNCAKVHNKTVFVYASPRGYVKVGHVIAELDETEHNLPSGKEREDAIYTCFLRALRIARSTSTIDK